MKRLLLLSLIIAATTACGRSGEPVDPGINSQIVQAGDTIVLHHGESARLGDSGTVITFRTVEADSRCPVDVTCVWAGDAHITLDARAPGDIRTIDLHSGTDPREARVAGYRIRLIDVAPQRREADVVTPRDYSVRLAISRG
jgi:hypothetical protein